MTRSRRRSLLRTFLLAGALAAIGCDKAPAPSPAAQPPLPAPPTGSRSTGPIAFASDRSGPSQIYLADEDGSVVTYLTEGSAPAWSPDGRQLAIQQAQQIVVINVDGSGRRVIGQGQAASWSPDGQQLALLSSNNNIEVVDVSGSNRRTLFASDWGVNSGPAWSPDGRLILFSLAFFIDVGTGLWTMSADGSGARDLNTGKGGRPRGHPTAGRSPTPPIRESGPPTAMDPESNCVFQIPRADR